MQGSAALTVTLDMSSLSLSSPSTSANKLGDAHREKKVQFYVTEKNRAIDSFFSFLKGVALPQARRLY